MLSGKIALLSSCSLGGICFAPFFASSDWGGQSSKLGKKWTIKTGNDEISSVYFPSDSINEPNQHLKGVWAFINNKKKNGSSIFSSGGFDIAISIDKLASSYEKPDISKSIARILYCNHDEREKTVKANISGTNKTIYCRDLSDSWYLGFIKGQQYRAIFTVQGEGLFKQGKDKNVDSPLKLTEENKGDFNDKLIENLKLATEPKQKFYTSAIFKNLQNNDCLKKGQKPESSSYECFFWTIIPNIGEEDQTKVNCSSKDSFDGCDIEIINVSKQVTLNSFSSFWNFDGKKGEPLVF